MFIESSKTDKYRDGVWVVVAVSGKVSCPVNMMNRYLDKAQLSQDSPFFASYLRLNLVVRPELKDFSYIRLRVLVFEVFTGIVPDLARIGTHRLRSGGATASSTLFTSRLV